MKCTCPTQRPNARDQTQPIFHWGFASGEMQILCFASGETQIFCVTVEYRLKAHRELGILFKIRMFISCGTSARIYKTMIRLHMEYVDFIVESGSKKLVSRLDKLQERALRRIEYCKKSENRKEYSVLEKEYKIENLSIRRNRNLLRYMFLQSKNEINKVNTKSDRILRSDKKLNLKTKFSNLSKLHNSPFYRGVRLWNRLSCEMQKCVESSSEFKTMLKNIIV